jgi:two-component system response regulator
MSVYPSSQHPSILVIDDNEDDFEAVARAFKKAGAPGAASLCTTGSDGLKFLREKGHPSLVMLDLNMPGMDGFQVLRHIREDEALKKLPVVIWTTSSNEKDIDACYQAGANAYMQKPVVFEDLLESVRRLKEYWLETALLPS